MDYKVFIDQLDTVIIGYSNLRNQSRFADLSDLPLPDRQSLVTRAIAAIHRISGANSTYSKEVDRILKLSPHLPTHTTSIIGLSQALKEDINAGYIQNVTGLIQAEIFSDFLEMGTHLLKEGYKDAAAVIIGSVLEDTLRKLAYANGIKTTNDKGKILTMEPLNIELAKKDIYNKLVQKQITSWADLRNNAAHGHYDKYDEKQVEMMALFVQNFCAENIL
jgi:hypothetical protein